MVLEGATGNKSSLFPQHRKLNLIPVSISYHRGKQGKVWPTCGKGIHNEREKPLFSIFSRITPFTSSWNVENHHHLGGGSVKI